MAVEVVMPQLGMAQETGVIAAWCKAPGDKVAVGDVLMEVETDKAVMEVEATTEGTLLSIDCETGVEVPVGSVVARIGASGEAAGIGAAQKPRAQSAGRPEHASLRPRPTSVVSESPGASRNPNRVLASPKARMRAVEQGLDLRELRHAGLAEPYHSADIDRYRQTRPAGTSVLRSQVAAGQLLGFVEWVAGNEGKAGMREVLCSFAAGAWREALGDEKTTVEYCAVAKGGARELLACTGRLAEVVPAPEGANAHVALHDMSGTKLTEYEPAGAPVVPALSFSHDGGHCCVTLRFSEANLPLQGAASFLDAFAGRLVDARLHLL